ncbi:MAG: hypothetical protein ACREUZ_21615, partial [Burkholderiales bacterium]
MQRDPRMALAVLTLGGGLCFTAAAGAQTPPPEHKHYEKPAGFDRPAAPGKPVAPRLQNLGVHT